MERKIIMILWIIAFITTLLTTGMSLIGCGQPLEVEVPIDLTTRVGGPEYKTPKEAIYGAEKKDVIIPPIRIRLSASEPCRMIIFSSNGFFFYEKTSLEYEFKGSPLALMPRNGKIKAEFIPYSGSIVYWSKDIPPGSRINMINVNVNFPDWVQASYLDKDGISFDG